MRLHHLAAAVLAACCLSFGGPAAPREQPWPTPAQIFEGIGTPAMPDAATRTWTSPDRRIAITATQAQVRATFDPDTTGLSGDEDMAIAMRIMIVFSRLVDNCVPLWNGAGLSAVSAASACQPGSTIILLHDHRRILLANDGRLQLTIIPDPPPAAEEAP